MAKARVSRAGDVAELVISAPPLNLFDGQMIANLVAALDELAALAREGTARAVLLRAEGKVFCAGVDVHEFQGLGQAQGVVLMARFLALVQTLERLPVPTIAVVHAPEPHHRVRAVPGLRPDVGGGGRLVRPGRGDGRPHPRRGRHPAPGRPGRRGPGGRAGDDR